MVITVMDQNEVQELYGRFSRPFDEHAALSAAPPDVRQRLARQLWLALIAGQPLEEKVWQALRHQGLRVDQLALVRRCYRELMRPQITAAELARLRESFLSED